jgi:squalene-hopene/tetraprenyl-beta-curcumene cyclase
MEPPYENHPTGAKTPRIDSHQVRKGAYWSLLAGAAGHGYGALDLFWLYKDGDGPFPKNGFQPWRKALAYEGSRQMGYVRRLFELRPWYKLVPDQSVIAAGEGEGEDLVRAARAEDGSFVIAYVPTGKPLSIKMDKLSGKTVKAQWSAPRTGTWQKIGEYASTGTREFTPPTHGEKADWVLVLEDAAKELPTARTGEPPAPWNPEKAGQSLDGRAKVWFGSNSCISCHTGLPYALARPALRTLAGTKQASEQEVQLLARIKKRVANWKDLDSKAFGLYYDANDNLKKQSWGTEAVFNALILAFDDRAEGRSAPGDATRQALVNLWQTQVRAGDNKGAWEWLDFNEAPWGNSESPYFGASLAAIAVGTAPGYVRGADTDTGARVALLRGYLKGKFEGQNLHNRIWGLWASTQLDRVLTRAEQKKLIDQLFEKQQDDGGWSLPALGTWVRHDRTTQEPASDAYATALILHVVQLAGVSKEDAKVARGLDWLRRNQSATGAWRSVSLVKKRDPATHAGQFMSDAATAYAVLALGH